MKPRNAFVHFFGFIILSWFSFKQKIQCFEWNHLRMPNNIALLSLKQPLSVKFALPFYLRTLSIYSAHDKTIKIVYLTSVFAYVHKISLFCPTSAFKNQFFNTYLFNCLLESRFSSTLLSTKLKRYLVLFTIIHLEQLSRIKT